MRDETDGWANNNHAEIKQAKNSGRLSQNETLARGTAQKTDADMEDSWSFMKKSFAYTFWKTFCFRKGYWIYMFNGKSL